MFTPNQLHNPVRELNNNDVVRAYGTGVVQTSPRPGVDGQYNEPFRGATTNYLEYVSNKGDDDYYSPVNQVERMEQAKPVTQSTDYRMLMRQMPSRTDGYTRDRELREARMRATRTVHRGRQGGWKEVYDPSEVIALQAKYAAEDSGYAQNVLNAYQQALAGRAGVTDAQVKREAADKVARTQIAQQGLANSGYAYDTDAEERTADRDRAVEWGRLNKDLTESAILSAGWLGNMVERFGADFTLYALGRTGFPQPGTPTIGGGAPVGTPTPGAPPVVGTPTTGASPVGTPTPGAPPVGTPTPGAPPVGTPTPGASPVGTPTPGIPALGGTSAAEAAAARRKAELDARKAAQDTIEGNLAQIARIAKDYGVLTPAQIERIKTDESMAAARNKLSDGFDAIRAQNPDELPVAAVQQLIRNVALTGGKTAVDAYGNPVNIDVNDIVTAHPTETAERNPLERWGGDVVNAFHQPARWLGQNPQMLPGSRIPMQLTRPDGSVVQVYIKDSIYSPEEVANIFPASGPRVQPNYRYPVLGVGAPTDQIAAIQALIREYQESGNQAAEQSLREALVRLNPELNRMATSLSSRNPELEAARIRALARQL